QTGQQTAEHDAVRPGRQSLRDVARIADAAIRDNRHVAPGDPLSRLRDRRYLGHADAGDHPRRADGSRPAADFHRVRPRIPPPGCPRAPSAVATLPAITSISKRFLISLTVSRTLPEWPWAESTTSTSTPARISDSARSYS